MKYDHRQLTRTCRTKIKVSETHSYAGEPCWEWTGSCDSSGYANLKMHGKIVLVHRYVHEKLIGPIELPCSLCRGRFGGQSGYIYTETRESIPCHRCDGTGLDPDPTVDHLCKGLRNCVQPAHFELVSRSENSTRANERRWRDGYRRNQQIP